MEEEEEEDKGAVVLARVEAGANDAIVLVMVAIVQRPRGAQMQDVRTAARGAEEEIVPRLHVVLGAAHGRVRAKLARDDVVDVHQALQAPAAACCAQPFLVKSSRKVGGKHTRLHFPYSRCK